MRRDDPWILVAIVIIVVAFGAFMIGRWTAPVQSCCTDVQAQLETITECKDFVIVDRDGCGPATQEYINDTIMLLDCGACYTEPAGDVWTVTMEEAQP